MASINAIDKVASGLTPISLLLIGAVTSGLLYALYLWALPKPLPGIPYDKTSASRILGDIPRLEALRSAGDTPRKFWCTAAAELGSPISQVFLGPFNKPAVIVSDFREAQDLQLRNAKLLSRGWLNRQLWDGLIPEHFIAMEDHDARYKDTRGLGKDLMTPNFLNQVNAPVSHVKVEDFIALWREKMQIAQGRPFDVLKDLSILTFDIILAAALGLDKSDSGTVRQLKRLRADHDRLVAKGDKDSLFSFPAPEQTELLHAMEGFSLAAAGAATSPSPWFYHVINNLTPSMRNNFRLKTTIMESYVDQASQRLAEEGSSFKPRAAVDYMVSREAALAEKAGRKPFFNSPRMQDALFGYLVGGQDSTHSTLSFLVKHLGQEQQIQSKLREALFQAYPDARANNEQPKLDAILKTKVAYLDAFIEEVLRSSNPSMVVSKDADEDLTIFGHHIPRGTMVLFTSYGPTITHGGARVDESLRSESSQKHREEGLGDWADGEYPGEEFHPERWLRPSDDGTGELVFDAKAGPILTFSAGPRMCWGRRLAYLELKLVVTLFVWNFVFERLPDHLHDWDVDDDLFIKPKHSRVRLSSVPPVEKVR